MDDFDAFRQRAKEIAEYFDVPPDTAASWKRNIGDLDVLKQKLGCNGPKGYLDLIKKRESIPYKLEEIENEWVVPLKKWYVKKTEDIYLVHESEHREFGKDKQHHGIISHGIGSEWWAVELKSQEENSNKSVNPEPNLPSVIPEPNWSSEMYELREKMQNKEKQIKYEMRAIDDEWIKLTRELRNVEKSLIEIYLDYIQDVEKDLSYKKDKIIELKKSFPYLQANNDLVSSALDCSISYARRFKKIPGVGVEDRNLSKEIKEEVLKRDQKECVRCGSTENLNVHHIIPQSKGGKEKKENLATLCYSCHLKAHGKTEDGTSYWTEVVYDSKEEFWNNWIKQS